jgi:hypothetical protein
MAVERCQPANRTSASGCQTSWLATGARNENSSEVPVLRVADLGIGSPRAHVRSRIGPQLVPAATKPSP